MSDYVGQVPPDRGRVILESLWGERRVLRLDTPGPSGALEVAEPFSSVSENTAGQSTLRQTWRPKQRTSARAAPNALLWRAVMSLRCHSGGLADHLRGHWRQHLQTAVLREESAHSCLPVRGQQRPRQSHGVEVRPALPPPGVAGVLALLRPSPRSICLFSLALSTASGAQGFPAQQCRHGVWQGSICVLHRLSRSPLVSLHAWDED